MGNRIASLMGSGRVALTIPPPRYIQPVIVRTGGEVYVFIYTDQTRDDAARWSSRHASNPDLNFTWVDSSRVTKTIRDLARKEAA